MGHLELSLMEMLDNATGWKTDYVLFPIDIRRYIAEQLEYATAQDIKDMIFSIGAYLQLTYSEHLRYEYKQSGREMPYFVTPSGAKLTDTRLMRENESRIHVCQNIRCLEEMLEKLSQQHSELCKNEIPQLSLRLSSEQIQVLFEQLKNNRLIAFDTDEKSFEWAFGRTHYPSKYEPIEWTASSKQAFRELLRQFVSVTNKMERDVEVLFKYKKQKLRLNKADSKPSKYIREIELIANNVKSVI